VKAPLTPQRGAQEKPLCLRHLPKGENKKEMKMSIININRKSLKFFSPFGGIKGGLL